MSADLIAGLFSFYVFIVSPLIAVIWLVTREDEDEDAR